MTVVYRGGGVQNKKHPLEFTSEASSRIEKQEKYKSSGTGGPNEDEGLCIHKQSKKG